MKTMNHKTSLEEVGDSEFQMLYDSMGELLAPSLVRDWPNIPIRSAKGCCFYGLDGREYLDFTSGMATVNTGHCHPKILEAARLQMDRLVHAAVGVAMYESILRLAEELKRITPGDLDMFFFSNSGAEAVEGAIKLAKYVTRRPAIVAFIGGFHGRTVGAMAVTSSKVKYRSRYEPLMSGVYHVPYAYCFRCPVGKSHPSCGLECLGFIDALFKRLVDPSEVAAFILEPMQGEGGYVLPPREWLAAIREICSKHGIQLIFDEVQTGFGRTGSWFAAQSLDVTPDILAMAKGIASGFPLSAVAAPAELMKAWATGAHGTTFGGNPISCRAALATIEVMEEEGLLSNARKMGKIALDRLASFKRDYPVVGDVRGIGLMIGIEFVKPGGEPDPGAVSDVLKRCLDEGLILYPCGVDGHVIRFIPPLIVDEGTLKRGLDVFERAVAGVSESRTVCA